MALADYKTLVDRFGTEEADRLVGNLGKKGKTIKGAPKPPTLGSVIGQPEYDPNKFKSMDDYVNAVNTHTKNFEIDKTGAINNTKTGETVGYENRTMGPNKTTVTGYSQVKQPPPTALSSAQTGNWWDKINSDAIEAVKAQIAQQTQALQDQLANNKLLTKQQVDAMNAQLAENVEKMQQMNNVNDFRIAENENRFGGTYSGGLRLQQAANDRSTNEAIGAATRDTQARSANLWSQYGQLAQQAYDKIANLSQQTPELVQQYISRALQNAGAYGALTGQLPGGGQTLSAQNQQFQQGMAQQQFQYGQQRDQVADERYNQEVAYQQARDAIADEREKRQFDEDVRRFGLQYALQKQNANTSAANAGTSRLNAEQGRLMDIWKATGVAPEGIPGVPAGTAFYDPNQSKATDMDAESRGLVSAIRSGELTPAMALLQIEQDQQLGFYTPEEAVQLKQVLQTLAPSVPTPQPTTNQQTAQEDFMANLPSDKEIERQARERGYPEIDYRSYMKDPKGAMSGISFEQWMQLYGPRMSAG